MGNVPISCCKSKSSKSDESTCRAYRNSNSRNSNRSKSRHDESRDKQSSPHILQHISEREPDDSETDPSSNPVDRPIFAARSCRLRNVLTQSISSNNHSEYVQNACQRNDKYDSNTSNCSQPQGSKSHSPKSDDDYNVNLVDSFNMNNTENKLNETMHDKQLQFQDDQDSNILDGNGIGSGDYQQSNRIIVDSRLGGNSLSISNQNLLLRISSCSTIHCDGSTISQPDLKQTIKAVSLAIYFHIQNRTSDNYVEIFDETIYPLKMPKNIEFNEDERDDKVDQKYAISESEEDIDQETLPNEDSDDLDRLKEPDRKTIYHFVKTLFKAAQLSSEYAITTLVYLERLMTYAEMDLTPKTWRRMFLGAIVLSSKVWEDQAVWNVDYAQILEEISVDDINELERHFLGLIQFNMNVPSSVYAKYYFHLRTLALVNGISKRYYLMTVKDAKTLEVSIGISETSSNKLIILISLISFNIFRHSR